MEVRRFGVFIAVAMMIAMAFVSPAPATAKAPGGHDDSPWHMYGESSYVKIGEKGNQWAIGLESRWGPYDYHGTPYEYSFAGVYFTPPNDKPIYFKDLSVLQFDFFMTEGNAYGGSPRFTLFMWDGVSPSWFVIYIYLGNPPSFIGGLPMNEWTSTGNFIGSMEKRFQIGWFPWTLADYEGALSLAGELGIYYIYLDLDSGWSGNDQAMLVDNICINNFVNKGNPP